jgi:hypothetical protein
MSTTDSPRERRKKTPSTERRGNPKHCDGDSAKKIFRTFFCRMIAFHALAIASCSVAACRMKMSEKTNAFHGSTIAHARNPYERKV